MCSIRKQADEAHAAFSSARAELLRAVAKLAETKAWHGDGAGDLASWLCARWQISRRTARELVRDAEDVRKRSALTDALAAGSISVDQHKALTVVGDSGSDEAWLEALPFWSLPELEREARKQTARELERRDRGTYLRMQHTPDERFMRGEFQLHPEDGAVVMAAIDSRIPDGTRLRDYDAAAAVALVDLATSSMGGPATVVVSVGDRDDVATLSSGGYIAPDTARRLACDARLQIAFTDDEDVITATGPTSRTIPPATRRAVEIRDGSTCTFPGCGRTTYLQCHHVLPYGEGGPTTVDNLVLVCWTHHRLVHEGGWSLRGGGGARHAWLRPDGSPFEPRVRVSLDTS